MVYCNKTCPMWSKTFASRYINFRAVCSSIHHQCWMKKVIMRCAEVRGYREDFQCRIFCWSPSPDLILYLGNQNAAWNGHYTMPIQNWCCSHFLNGYWAENISTSLHSFKKNLTIALVVGPRTYNTMVLAYLLPVLTRVTQPWYLLIATHCTTCRRRAERGPAGECR